MIDELVREGARRMPAEALQAEVDDYIARHISERDADGRRLVVRNGSHQPREVLTSAGAVEVVAPRVNDRRVDAETGQRRRFSSAILPALGAQDPEDHRGAAAALPARPVLGGLRARPGPVPRLDRGAALLGATLSGRRGASGAVQVRVGGGAGRAPWWSRWSRRPARM
ncbi:transposase [Pseudonocardia sp. S2-4]|uniref:Transposase n=1 Tax=Pseudonocardia humida TaxID=2800819 RepID=A0ABT1ADA4_9PSEU|nr:transposase [Pseudonocardia humida]MCO1661035.1 transposase [Pseudonocardia humida]